MQIRNSGPIMTASQPGPLKFSKSRDVGLFQILENLSFPVRFQKSETNREEKQAGKFHRSKNPDHVIPRYRDSYPYRDRAGSDRPNSVKLSVA